MKKFFRFIWNLFTLFPKACNRLLISKIKKGMLGECGKNVYLGKHVEFNWHNVYIKDNVSVGDGALFICSRAKIIIGSNVMFAPNVTMITGNHTVNIPGMFIKDITDKLKRKDEDRNIIISGDNWIGANVTILRGVIVGYGSVIGAGSVVTKSIPKYEIWAGNPAKFIKKRFEDDELEKHIKIMKDKGFLLDDLDIQ